MVAMLGDVVKSEVAEVIVKPLQPLSKSTRRHRGSRSMPKFELQSQV
jgi:hypothetical protein